MGGPALNQNLKMFILLLLMLVSCSTAASPEKTECTEGLKGRASLKFSECREPLIPLKQCYKLYPDTLGSTSPGLDHYGVLWQFMRHCEPLKFDNTKMQTIFEPIERAQNVQGTQSA